MAPFNKNDNDTIFALASGAGRAGVSIMRVSGPQSLDIVKTLTGGVPLPRKASLRVLKSPFDKTPIDEALVLVFKGPASFTGEDMAEFQVHGSPAVVEALGESLLSLGLRQARAGEFTRRAFDNGRMDLTQAEGLADLIDSDTQGQRQQAIRQMRGGLTDIYERWRTGLIDVLASIEGEIDFPDEGDIPDRLSAEAGPKLEQLIKDLSQSLESYARGERVRHGIDIAIVGPPNAGKSSLLNAMALRDVAIVSKQPGTTRDVIEVNLVLAGLPVRVSDTAGLRETGDEIESEGIARAKLRAEEADIRIGVLGSKHWPEDLSSVLKAGDILALNKSDIVEYAQHDVSRETFMAFELSALTGEGLKPLLKRIEQEVAARFGISGDAGLTRARHRDCVQRCLESVKRAGLVLDQAPELAGDDLRSALHAIKELAGEADIAAVLGLIFSRFCVGK